MAWGETLEVTADDPAFGADVHAWIAKIEPFNCSHLKRVYPNGRVLKHGLFRVESVSVLGGGFPYV